MVIAVLNEVFICMKSGIYFEIPNINISQIYCINNSPLPYSFDLYHFYSFHMQYESWIHFPIILKLVKRLIQSKDCCLGLLMTIFTITHGIPSGITLDWS